MKWLTNISDPRRKEARALIQTILNETPEQAWQRQERYLAGKIIGDPKATDRYSVDELKAMGMVGVYNKESGHENKEI